MSSYTSMMTTKQKTNSTQRQYSFIFASLPLPAIAYPLPRLNCLRRLPPARPSLIHSICPPVRSAPIPRLPPIRPFKSAPLPRVATPSTIKATPHPGTGISLKAVAAGPTPVVSVFTCESVPELTPSLKRKREASPPPTIPSSAPLATASTPSTVSHPAEKCKPDTVNLTSEPAPKKVKANVTVPSLLPGKENVPVKFIERAAVGGDSNAEPVATTSNKDTDSHPKPKPKPTRKPRKSAPAADPPTAVTSSDQAHGPDTDADAPIPSIDTITPLVIHALVFTKLSALSIPDLAKSIRSDHPNALPTSSDVAGTCIHAALEQGVRVG